MRSPLARWQEHLLGAPGTRCGPRPAIGPITRLRVGFALAPSRTAAAKPSRAKRFPFETLTRRFAAARFLLLLALLSQVSALAGCAYCASPYDYCGPTFTDNCGECLVDERYGSILSGPMFRPISGTEFLPEGYEELGPYEPSPDEAYAPSAEEYAPPGEELPEPAPLEELLPEPRLEDTIPEMPPDLRPPFDEGRRPRSIRLRR